MKETDNTKLITVGELLKELKGYEKDCAEYVVNIDTPDGSTLNIMSTGFDKDGDLNIEVDEEPDEGYYDVQMLIDDLEGYDKNARVYLEGCGLYWTFTQNPDGSVFGEPNDVDEAVGCEAVAFGECKYETTERLTEEERRLAAKKKQKNTILTIVLAVITLAIFAGLCYNVYAIVVRSTRHPLWESILWIAVCVFLLVICGLTLYYNFKEKK